MAAAPESVLTELYFLLIFFYLTSLTKLSPHTNKWIQSKKISKERTCSISTLRKPIAERKS